MIPSSTGINSSFSLYAKLLRGVFPSYNVLQSTYILSRVTRSNGGGRGFLLRTVFSLSNS